MMRGNFEYAMEAFPFWQSYTPMHAAAELRGCGGASGQREVCNARRRSRLAGRIPG